MLWFPVGYTAGYLVLLVLVAAPLRRSGAYTLPDFAELRLGSRRVRLTASVLVVAIGWLYLLPQLQGAGLALRAVTGLPGWVGAPLVAIVVVLNVAGGGMRSITLGQAFQYWLKLTAIGVPAFFLLAVWTGDGPPSPAAPGPPLSRATSSTTMAVDTMLRVDVAAHLVLSGTMDGQRVDGEVDLSAGSRPVLSRGTVVTVPAGITVPHAVQTPAVEGERWVLPLSGAGARDHPLYSTYSIILALFFGTMGLPHVLVRFYTNPDGRAARRSTLVVLALLGAFYLFPPLYGALAACTRRTC